MSDKQFFETAYDEYIFQNSADAVFIIKDHIITNCNYSALKLLGCDLSLIVGRSLSDFSYYHDAVTPDILAEDETSEKGDFKKFEWICSGVSGKILTDALVFDKGANSFQHVIVKVRDSAPLQTDRFGITDMIINVFPGFFFVYDVTAGFEEARLARFNRKWYKEKFGYSLNQVPDSYPSFVFSPSKIEKTLEIIRQLDSQKSAEFEIDMRHKDGYDIPYLFVTNIIESGEQKFFTGIGVDLTERKYTEQALKQSEEYFKNIFNSSTDGILIMDLEYKLLNANNVVFKLFDYKFEDVVFQNVLDLVPSQSRSILIDRVKKLVANEQTPPFELEIKKRTGELVPVEINSIIIHYGDRTGILTTIRNLTERKMLEKRIFNSEIRSEEKERERFAKELHDGLGPILSTCKIYLHSLNEMLEGRQDLLKISERSLNLLDEALGSIKEISNNLSPHVLRNFGLVHAVIAFTHNLSNISGIRIEVHYNYEERLYEIIEFTAYRIITELINNSLKYSEATLIVVDIILEMPFLRIAFSDNGKGFDLTELRRLNRGFGLRNIEARINKFNGSYSYKTAPGEGVKVEFTLDTNYSDK